MSTKFANVNGDLYLTSESSVLDHLPLATYSLKCDDKGNFFLSPINNFTLPSKVYGNNSKYAQRILNTFKQRTTVSTAAILSGLKGSGKSITAKEISILAAQEGISTIVINEPFRGTSFNEFVQKLPPVILLFDEFEKTYEMKSHRQALLTLLDGTFNSHKLYLMTMNLSLKNSGDFHYFNNRPGRIYFNIEYGTLTSEIIQEYCADHLTDQSKIQSIIKFVAGFNDFTLDLLSALVSEMNSTNESPQELSEILNIKPNKELDSLKWDYEFIRSDGKVFKDSELQTSFSVSDFLTGCAHEYVAYTENYSEDDSEWIEEYFHPEKCTTDFKEEVGQIIITDEDGNKLVLTKQKPKQYVKHFAF